MASEIPNQLRLPSRFITDHNDEGKAIFSTAIPEPAPTKQIPNDAVFALMYATKETPVDLTKNKDLSTYENYLTKLPGIMVPGGSVFRMVDMPPGATSPMHRTVSLDYGIVIEGEVELILDSGEVRLMKRGDVSIQRGTMHAWRNTNPDGWARMLYVLLEAKELEIAGNKLGEDYGGLEVAPSKAE